MAELTTPQRNTVELETVAIEPETLKELNDLNNKQVRYVNEFGQLYLRKKEIQEELERIEDAFEQGETDFKELNAKIKELIDSVDEKYPQSRIDLQAGTLTYQPGAPTRKQQLEQQRQQISEEMAFSSASPEQSNGGMKVVKE